MPWVLFALGSAIALWLYERQKNAATTGATYTPPVAPQTPPAPPWTGPSGPPPGLTGLGGPTPIPGLPGGAFGSGNWGTLMGGGGGTPSTQADQILQTVDQIEAALPFPVADEAARTDLIAALDALSATPTPDMITTTIVVLTMSTDPGAPGAISSLEQLQQSLGV